MSIRNKVTLPYLVLTLLVMSMGVYVVTRLVASSLGERLTNQLLEAGRVVSDEVAKQETEHLKAAQIIAYTRGLAEAVRDGDQAQVAALAKPAARGMSVEYLAIISGEGRVILQVQRLNGGPLIDAKVDPSIANLAIVQALLAGKDPNAMPRRQLGMDGEGVQYYFSAIPIVTENNRAVGVVVVGTTLNALLPTLKNTSLADVTFYGEGGLTLASTFIPNADVSKADDMNALLLLSITPQAYQEALNATDFVSEESLNQSGREYRVTRGPMQISSDHIGVFSVALPLNFVLQSAENSRNTYVLLFFMAMVMVIAIGLYVARLITHPLNTLVSASNAISKGDLSQRTGLKRQDEIGTLASAFDAMTENLQERTEQLKKTNRVLEQMDRTKGNFIQISAHELRTPLTLMQGYAQILEQRAKAEPDLVPVVKGILDGSSRMNNVINSMLDVSRIDSKTLKVMPTKQQIGAIMAKAQRAFKTAIVERKQTLILKGLDELPPIHLDAELMYKVFYNLLMNAIKFTPDGGTITVSGRVVDGSVRPPEVEVAVHDMGIGIDPQNHEAIFEKFYQTGEVMLHSSGKSKFKGGGPGLGLAIARGIVEAHHGRIWVESPGYDESACPGSVFYVRLPLNGQGK